MVVYELVSSTQSREAENAALCQLALVGANHLMEVALYKLLLPHTQAEGLTKTELEEATYYEMLTCWFPKAVRFRWEAEGVRWKKSRKLREPYRSTECLRKWRNKTIHKSSASTTIQMAKSALFSAVQGTRDLYKLAGVSFPYKGFSLECPWPEEICFFDAVRGR
jgi:hypothetical protein